MVEAAVPVPDSATVSGLPGALLVTDRVPVAAPAAVGRELDADGAGAARGDGGTAAGGLIERPADRQLGDR